MPNDPAFDQPGWQPQTVYNVAGNLNQGAPAAASTPPAVVSMKFGVGAFN